MHARRLWMVSLWMVPLWVACDEPEDCGKVETCPVGTVIEEYRSDREGFELSGDASTDFAGFEGGLAYRRFESGTCEWSCVAIQECPDSTFPVIDEDCFTCGMVTDDGEVVQGDCDG